MQSITAKQAKEIDILAKEKFGISTLVLMENAGSAICHEVLKLAKDKSSLKIAIFCGKGNNGGDGFVAARHLLTKGIGIDVFLAGKREEVKNEAKINLGILINLGQQIQEIIDTQGLELIDFRKYDFVIDALLGVGLLGPVRGIFKDIINRLNNAGLPILSVDVPSGLDADTGEILGACITAAETVTFVAVKQGMLRGQGSVCCGRILVKDLGLPVIFNNRHSQVD